MHLYLRAVLLLTPTCALLQVHTRLAKAILNKAKIDAMQQREALLAQAEHLFTAAAEIDDALAKLDTGGAVVPPSIIATAAPPPPEEPSETALRRLCAGDNILKIVDFAGDAAATAPLDVARAVALDSVFVLAWRGGADGVDVGGGLTALAVRRDDGAGCVVVVLESEAHARQTAHVMTSLDGFAMEATRVSLDAAADAVLARSDCALGVVLLDSEE